MNKVNLVVVVLPLALSLISLPANAGNNLVSNLFGAITDLGKTLGNPNTGNQDQAKSDTPAPNEIMSLLASQEMHPYCNEEFVKKRIDQTISQYKMGEYGMAGGDALLQAQTVAACALKNKGMNMSQAEKTAGFLLALSAISKHKAGLDTPANIITAQNALTLLKLDASGNQDIISQVEKSGVIPAKAPTSAVSPYVKMTAYDAATKYNGNSFAFKKEYTGKTLRVSGEIQRIGGSEKDAFIVLAGVRKADRNDEGWNDVVQCTIKEENAMKDAMNISTGQKISVQGIYNPGQFGIGVSLQDCKIVNE